MGRASEPDSACPVVPITSWPQFAEHVADPAYRGWAFRGQADAGLPLETALTRHLLYAGVHRAAWPGQEERVLRIFQRKGHLFLTHVPPEDDAFQWLALMQHHGAPTRLLDLTWSPYVAAFFALERGRERAAVWGFDAARINRPAGDGPTPADIWQPGTFERDFLPGTNPVVVIGEPKVMNRRLTAQAGTFLIPGVIDRPVDAVLAARRPADRVQVKFEFDTAAVRADAMRALYAMNITPATLFPDLDGLARSLAYELEFHWAFDPRTMDPFPGFPPPDRLAEWVGWESRGERRRWGGT